MIIFLILTVTTKTMLKEADKMNYDIAVYKYNSN